jgi:hypothetical protein
MRTMVDLPEPDNPMITKISPGFDGKAGIVDPHGHAGLFVDGFLVVPLLEKLHGLFRLVAENFVQVFYNDLFHFNFGRWPV